MIEGARKALEYALLLPAPHIGQFGSLALNISADKRHCRGDVFGAIEEYKLALLADEDNVLAWNSLGVCLASLGRHAEARRFFEEAIQRTPDDPALAYNLGAVCQSLHDNEAAAEHFRTCIRLSPSHLYALIRLGSSTRRMNGLKRPAPGSSRRRPSTPGARSRTGILARLALRLGKADLAREHLHQALLRNPRDVAALSLMADLYLDGGEDPELAESLAARAWPASRIRNGWLVLSRALEVQGRLSDAREAFAEGRGIVEKPDWKRRGGLFAEGVLLFSPATAVTLLRSPPPFPRTSQHGPRPLGEAWFFCRRKGLLHGSS